MFVSYNCVKDAVIYYRSLKRMHLFLYLILTFLELYTAQVSAQWLRGSLGRPMDVETLPNKSRRCTNLNNFRPLICVINA